MNIAKQKENVYEIFNKYYSGLVLTKVSETQEKDSNPSYSLYYAKACGMLCVENMYIVVVIEYDFNRIGTSVALKSLKWISFQTRTLNTPPIVRLIPTSFKTIIDPQMQEKIKIAGKKSDRFIYLAERLPLRIELLLNEHQNSYSDNGTIESALQMFNCVVTLTL